ncbi:hypothetical protein [Vibrio misgurnus]|uniref:hypothetical protein n=1 Tax=Vibrio misgurnus TaxID=2993714 RepID=UPI0023F81826|nr:hypothetical protein [Vibrio sp. VCS]
MLINYIRAHYLNQSTSAEKIGNYSLAKKIISVKNASDNKKINDLRLSIETNIKLNDKDKAKKLIGNLQAKINNRMERLSKYENVKFSEKNNSKFETKSSLPTSSNIQIEDIFNLSDNSFLGSGSRGKVYRSGSIVIKDLKTTFHEELTHELLMCNAWLEATGNKDKKAKIYAGNQISMPYRDGIHPNNESVKKIITTMFEKGFMMGDPCSENFILDKNGNLHPIDFGLFFKFSDLESIPTTIASNIIRDYVNGGYKNIPTILKSEYNKCIEKLDNKSPTLGRMNIRLLVRSGII